MLKCVIEQRTFTLTFNQLADAFSQNTERQSNGQKEQKWRLVPVCVTQHTAFINK